jgi:AcrR family transcriptional regulator
VAWDTEGTKRKILDAAAVELASKGPDGTTIEQIARLACVNKERVYKYFGGKAELFALVIREKLAAVEQVVPVSSCTPDGLAEYAGQLFDFAGAHPELVRLILWESLAFTGEVPGEQFRREFYGAKTDAFREAQDVGLISGDLPPDHLNFMLIALAVYWVAAPQVSRMMTGTEGSQPAESARRRASVVEAARRLVEPAAGLVPGESAAGSPPQVATL